MQKNERMFYGFLVNHTEALLEVTRSLHLHSATAELEELLDNLQHRLANDDDFPSSTTTNNEVDNVSTSTKTDVSQTQVSHDVAARGKLLNRP